MYLHSIDNLITATGGRISDERQRAGMFNRVEIDSRKIRPSEVFWAIPGERCDGHNFTTDAFENHAVACVVEAGRCESRIGTIVEVDDTLKALSNYAAWWRQQQSATVVGITGSFGKTTTREMLHSVLSQNGSGVRSQKNYNNHIGLPLSVLDIQSHHTYAVVEIGASARGEVEQLAEVARPQIGVVTAVGPAHLEGFGNVSTIASSKAELIESLSRVGLAVLSGDDPHVRQMASCSQARVLFVGESEINDVRASDVEVNNHSLSFVIDTQRYRVPVAGRHHLTSAIVSVALGREFGISPRGIEEGLQQFRPATGRCHYRRIGSWDVIDDTYNSSPRALDAACQLLSDWSSENQKILVTGDMLELGTESEQLHYEAGRSAGVANLDFVIAVGVFAAHVAKGARKAGLSKKQAVACETVDEAIEVLHNELQPNDVVLVKGSRGMRMERVIHALEQNEIELDSAICAGFAGIHQHRSAGERERTTCLDSVVTGSITPNSAQ